jgi:hypothetical protein
VLAICTTSSSRCRLTISGLTHCPLVSIRKSNRELMQWGLLSSHPLRKTLLELPIFQLDIPNVDVSTQFVPSPLYLSVFPTSHDFR